MYAAAREAGVTCDLVHFASDDRLVTLPSRPGRARARQGSGVMIVVTTEVRDGFAGAELNPNRHGGSSRARAPSRAPSKRPEAEVTVAYVGGAVELPAATAGAAAGPDPAQQRPRDRVGHRRPGGRGGQRGRHQPQQGTQRGTATDAAPELQGGSAHVPLGAERGVDLVVDLDGFAPGPRRRRSVEATKAAADSLGASSTRWPSEVSTITSANSPSGEVCHRPTTARSPLVVPMPAMCPVKRARAMPRR